MCVILPRTVGGAQPSSTIPTHPSERAVNERSVLLVAYHFPPAVGSSGLQRTLRFAEYLPEFGWRPVVLTVNASAHEQTDERTLSQIPAGCEVIRSRCIDVGRTLSIGGKYPRLLALPDRWASWQLSAAAAAARLARQRTIDAIWTTYPIATAHRIGSLVARRTGLPWLADFRDPMAQDGYPPEPLRWRSFKRIEEAASRDAARLIFVSPSALEMYRSRYPETPGNRFVLIENGYDEASCQGLQATQPRTEHVPMLLHSGIVYPDERDPSALFAALGRLKAADAIRPGDFFIRFRAPVHEDLLAELARKHSVEAFVEICPPLPYREALSEMLEADALIVMQGATCNEQIPAKMYEYLRARRPILPLTDPAGDTGRALAGLGYSFVTKLEDTDSIVSNLPAFLSALREGILPMASGPDVERFSRRALTKQLAELLAQVCSEPASTIKSSRGEIVHPSRGGT